MTSDKTQRKYNNLTAGKSAFLVLLISALFSGFIVTKSLKAEGSFVDLNFVVTNQSGSPISGANISIDQDFGNGTSRTTDGGGFVNFGVLDNTSINYNVSANGCDDDGGNVNSGNGTTVNVSMNCDSTSGDGGNQNPSWPQDIQYSINDAGNGVVGYYNVKTSGNKVFNWNVNVSSFDGPGTMHVRTIGAYDDTAGSAPTTAHGFSVPSSGKVDYRNPPESGSFSFSYDTRYRTCGRVQIDGSFIDDRTGSDSQLFYAIVVDYGDDCVASVNQAPVITLVGSNPVTFVAGSTYTDAGATALDPEDGNITSHIVKTSNVNSNVPGTYTVTYNVSDSKGLAAVPVTRTVVVTPANQRPVITLVGLNPVSLTVGSTYTDAGATALDPEDGNITANIVKTGTVNTAVVGTYTITYNVSDSKGLAAVPVTRTVNVIAAPVNNRPVITLVGSTPINIVVGALYIDQGATATDVEDGNITANIVKTGTVNTAVVGTYTITYNVSDSKGLAAVPVTRTVNVTALPTSTVIATKIVCNSESDLPNWGNGGSDITATTASSFLASHPNCHPESNWQFQWALGVVVNNVDNIIGPVTLPWTTSSLTDSNGSVSIVVPVSSEAIWFREVMKSGYIGFSGWFAGEEQTKGYDYSAEMYCNTDVLNYDNFETIGNTEAGKTYYCIAFNTLIPENQRPVITLVGLNPITIIAGSTYTDAGATALDPEDGNITANIVKTGTVNTTVVGTYTITYNVSDSKGLAAVPVTRTVVVVPAQSTQCTIPDSIGDNTVEEVLVGPEPSLASVINNYGITISDQNQYQTWHINKASTTINVTFLDGYTIAGDVFGYYKKGDTNSFVPLFVVGGTNATYANVPSAVKGATYSVSVPAGDIAFAIHTSIQDGGFRTSENSLNTNSGDYMVSYDIATTSSSNYGSYIVAFEDLDLSTADKDYNDIIVKIDVTACETLVQNQRPVITLVGLNPATVTKGNAYLDPGATANDHEDGDITNKIVVTGDVDTSIVGSYTVTYNVVDSKGLAAIPVSRTVNVLEDTQNTPKGQITFCLALANDQNSLATSSLGLPSGIFTMNLGTTTDIASTLVQSKSWNTSIFAPNTKIILQQNDADCVTYSNLDLGTYYYSSTTISGSRWNVSKYNDKYNQTINNVFDFFNYSPELFTATTTDDSLRNMNSDGQIVLTADNKNQSVTIYSTYNPAPQCLLPEITSQLAASVTVNTPFTYTLTASSTSDVLNVATSTLPAGLSYATSTGVISGTPTQSGTFNIALSAANVCGTTTAVLILTVNPPVVTPSANLSIIKTVDKVTANVGDTVVYTIIVTNTGSSTATNVIATESFPSLLNFVSATSTAGSYATSTNIWTIGSLLNGSSTTLTLVGTVKSGSENQTITNSVNVTSDTVDPDTTNNTSTTTTVVNPAPCTTCGGGGGTPSTNLSVLKTADKSSLGVGETITYTISATNSGPDNATGVYVTDILSDKLNFVSATSTMGSYSTTTGIWTIGSLLYSSSTTLVITATVKSGSEGVKIPNSAVISGGQSDPDSNNNTSTVDVNVNVPPCTTCGGGGGGGGGGGNGPIVGSYGNGPIIPQVAGATEVKSCYYLYDYLRKDFNNNPVEVTKLQVFLRDLEGYKDVMITGIYDDQTIVALNAFQWRYKDDVLTPWGHTAPTSYTYILTKKKVNEIYCKMAFPVNTQQQEEIDNYRNFLLSLRNAGITVPTNVETPSSNPTSTSTPAIIDVVGSNINPTSTSTKPTDLTTLAGVSSTTERITDGLTATVLLAGKKFANAATAFFAWPFKNFGNRTTQCVRGLAMLGWINLLLVILIIVVSYFWYREYKSNKILEDINKEIDLN